MTLGGVRAARRSLSSRALRPLYELYHTIYQTFNKSKYIVDMCYTYVVAAIFEKQTLYRSCQRRSASGAPPVVFSLRSAALMYMYMYIYIYIYI